MRRSIYVGWDPREADAWQVAHHSIMRRLTDTTPVHKLSLGDLQERGLYSRPTRREGNRLIDELSIREDYDGSVSTEHACARFFVPHLAREGWALFVDGDVLARADLSEVFRDLDPRYAVYCVKHFHRPRSDTKMDGQLQTYYLRKNWSSFVIFNCDHPANAPGLMFEAVTRPHLTLTRDALNTLPGRDLHRFCWLRDDEIGTLGFEWNHLVGYTPRTEVEPRLVHFTEGTPDMPGYEDCEFADEWRAELTRCGRGQVISAEVA